MSMNNMGFIKIVKRWPEPRHRIFIPVILSALSDIQYGVKVLCVDGKQLFIEYSKLKQVPLNIDKKKGF